MKRRSDKLSSTVQNIQSSHAMQIANTPEIYDILSNRLYRDPILAPVRELWLNAIDSHIANGNLDTPFLVVLPTYDNPVFRMRDYGLGLSWHDMDGLYSTYGMSNKTHSDEFTGCMGIGSKSPFAYVDSFVAMSYFNGNKYIFAPTKDNRGKPFQNFVGTEATDEPNGLDVSFAVKKEDIDEFREAAAKVCRYSPIIPVNLEGEPLFSKRTVNPTEVVFSGTGWRLVSTKSRYGYGYSNPGHSVAIMGHIGYKIESDHFEPEAVPEVEEPAEFTIAWYQYANAPEQESDEPEDEGEPEVDTFDYSDLLDQGLELDFDMGEIQFDAGREGLQYHKRTVKSVKEKLKVVRAEVDEIVENALGECYTLWQARCVYSDMLRKNRRLFKLCEVAGKMEFEGTPLGETTIDPYYKLPGVTVTKMTYNYGDIKTTKKRTSVSCSKKTALVINDMPNGGFAAAKRWIHSNAIDNRELEDDQKKPVQCWVFNLKDNADRIAFFTTFGCLPDECYYTSQFPKLARQVSRPRATMSKEENEVLVWRFQKHASNRSDYRDVPRAEAEYWERVAVPFHDEDNDEPQLFVGIKGKKLYRHRDELLEPYQLNNLLKMMDRAGIDTPNVYGVSLGRVQKFVYSEYWDNVWDWAIREIKKFAAGLNIPEVEAASRNYSANGIKLNEIIRTHRVMKKSARLLPPPIFDDLAHNCKVIRDSKNAGGSIDTAKRLLRQVGESDEFPEIEPELKSEDVVKTYEELYPMLNTVGHNVDDHIKTIREYMLEQERKLV